MRHSIEKPMHSVEDKVFKNLFEVYDTESPFREVWYLNFIMGIKVSHIARHDGKPNDLKNESPINGFTGNFTIQKEKFAISKPSRVKLQVQFTTKVNYVQLFVTNATI